MEKLLRAIFGDSAKDLWLKLDDQARQQIMDNIGRTLSFRDYRLVMSRLGVNDGIVRSLKEIASEFRITRERARQVEAQAIRNLQNLDWSEIINLEDV